MVYITGDTHADLMRFKDRAVKRLGRDDYLIVCGDFGFVWNNSKEEQKLLKKLGKQRFTTLFLDGTHDNIPLIRSYPSESWQGGDVRRISGNLLYLERGEVFELDGLRIFVMGGGSSRDLDVRIEGESWWRDEMPCDEEFARAEKNLERVGWQVDYILTHEPPADIEQFLSGKQPGFTPLGDFLNALPSRCSFSGWFFASLHRDKVIPPRHTAVFRQLIPLTPVDRQPQ